MYDCYHIFVRKCRALVFEEELEILMRLSSDQKHLNL
jgi:hypothetical protein